MESIVTDILLLVLSGALTAFWRAFTKWTSDAKAYRIEQQKKQEEENAAQSDALRSLLRTAIFKDHHEGVRKGFMTTMEKEIITRNYESYHKLDGNGVATNLYEEAMALPTIDDEE